MITIRNQNKPFIIAVIVALLLVVSCTGILAYLAATDERGNEWRIGYVDVAVEEEYKPPGELVPGDSFVKNVKATNKGVCNAYVRIKIVFSNEDMQELCELDYNTTNFTLGDDGYWYYNDILEAFSSTPSLFTTVTLSASANKDDLEDFEIQVYAEAYQSDEFDTYKDAWEHFNTNTY